MQQIADIKSGQGYSIIFKHSTRCSISLITKKRLEMDWTFLPDNIPVYFLDLINYRDISNTVADIFKVHHESPQLLLIKDGECVYETSHGEISMEDAVGQIN
jgi:bacillithiol system protein YtxJ